MSFEMFKHVKNPDGPDTLYVRYPLHFGDILPHIWKVPVDFGSSGICPTCRKSRPNYTTRVITRLHIFLEAPPFLTFQDVTLYANSTVCTQGHKWVYNVGVELSD